MLFDRFDRILTVFLRVLYGIGAAIVVPMVLLIAGGTFSRYFFNTPIPGNNELSAFMLLAMVLLIAGYCQITNVNVTMGILVDHLPQKVQNMFDILSAVFCTVMSFILTYATTVQAAFITQTKTYSTVLEIPLGPLYYLIAVGWGGLTLGSLLLIARTVRKAVTK